MKELYDRTKRLVGSDGMMELKDARVLIVGLGGVGGFAVEALARAGVGTLGLCDFDQVDPSNLNRQILALADTLGRLKAEVAKERVLAINPDCNVKLYPFRLEPGNIASLDIQKDCPEGYKLCCKCGKCLPKWDFIVDAIDDVPAKLALIEHAYKMNIPIICSMGTGNKLDPFGYKIVPIEKTEGDPLARAIRKRLREKDIKGIPVLYSAEQPVVKLENGNPIPTISYMPAIAGELIAGFVIKKIIASSEGCLGSRFLVKSSESED